MTEKRGKATIKSINRLKNIGPTSNAAVKFILDSAPGGDDDDDNEPSQTEDWIITGRLLPNSEIYRNGAIRMQMMLPTGYPFEPPKICLKTPVFHPNVTKEGEVCIELLRKDGTWSPTKTLDEIIKEVTHVIDNPRIDYIQYTEAANLYNTNREEYTRIASEIFNKNCAPRN